MGKIKVTDIDKGWKKIVGDLRKLKNAPYAKVGLVGPTAGATHEESAGGESLTVATIGMIHEYGSESRNIPERSFIRGPLEANQENLRSFIKKLSFNLASQKMDVAQALGLLGLEGVRIIKKAITVDRIKPSLDPKTVKAKTRAGKKGDTPLVDTGQMQNSVRHQVMLSGKDEE